MCKVYPREKRNAVANIRENDISVTGPRIFSLRQAIITHTVGRLLDLFNTQMDSFLQGVPDQSGCITYNIWQIKATNSLTDQALTKEAWLQTVLRG